MTDDIDIAQLNGHIEIVEQCRDYLSHRAMDEGDPTGKLFDFVQSMHVVLDALEQARKERDALRRPSNAAFREAMFELEQSRARHKMCQDSLASACAERDALRQQLEAVTRERDNAREEAEASEQSRKVAEESCKWEVGFAEGQNDAAETIASWLENHASAYSESVRAKSRLGAFGTSSEAKQSIHNAEQREIGMLQAADEIRAGKWRAKEGK